MSPRDFYKADSNNKANPLKNICALRVAETLGVAETVHYLHTMNDLVRAARNRFTVRSRFSKVKGKSVGAARAKLAKIGAEEKAVAFIVGVDGHALLLDHEGNTMTDTAKRKRDRRKIQECFIVLTKG